MGEMETLASTASSASPMEARGSTRTALIIDGSYAIIGARSLGGKIDYIKLRAALEKQAATQFGDCWFFDHSRSAQQLNPGLTGEYHMLKFAPPDGPQFQVSLFPMKRYSCQCKSCGCRFTQNVQKGVDNGIATKILSLAYENICDRFVLFAGDGDFYSSLSHVRNVLRKDIWVIGYRGTVSGDLQQLASRVIWMNNIWSQVKNTQQVNFQEKNHRDERCRRESRLREDQFDECSSSSFDEAQDGGSGRHVVIAPRSIHSKRGRSRSRDGRLKGRGRSKNGRARSRSRDRDRSRLEKPRGAMAAINAVLDVGAMNRAQAVKDVETKFSLPGGKSKVQRNEKKRKWDGTERVATTSVGINGYTNAGEASVTSRETDKYKQKRLKQSWRADKQANDFSELKLSDVSSDEYTVKPPSLSMSTPLKTVLGRDSMAGEIINLADDSESE